MHQPLGSRAQRAACPGGVCPGWPRARGEDRPLLAAHPAPRPGSGPGSSFPIAETAGVWGATCPAQRGGCWVNAPLTPRPQPVSQAGACSPPPAASSPTDRVTVHPSIAARRPGGQVGPCGTGQPSRTCSGAGLPIPHPHPVHPGARGGLQSGAAQGPLPRPGRTGGVALCLPPERLAAWDAGGASEGAAAEAGPPMGCGLTLSEAPPARRP